MALGVLGGLASIIMDGPTGEKPAWMSLCGIDAFGDATKPTIPQRAFQYWPESISDTIEVGWAFSDIPGASHALAAWGSNNGRTIAFEVTMARLMKPKEERTALEQMMDPFGMTKAEDDPEWNADVAGGIRYLRAFCYPLYMKGERHVEAYPPPVAILHAPGLNWNEKGGDAIFAVMTGCDVTYVSCFPSGTPRLATLSLTFRQVVQQPLKGVTYVGRQKNAVGSGAAPYKLEGDTWNGAKHGVGKFDPSAI
jgi:hypothetical protein